MHRKSKKDSDELFFNPLAVQLPPSYLPMTYVRNPEAFSDAHYQQPLLSSRYWAQHSSFFNHYQYPTNNRYANAQIPLLYNMFKAAETDPRFNPTSPVSVGRDHPNMMMLAQQQDRFNQMQLSQQYAQSTNNGQMGQQNQGY